jgi:hypothetical protein
MTIECLWIRGIGHPPIGPMGGVVQVSKTMPFHTPVQYNTFPNAQSTQTSEYYEIFRTQGNAPRHCPILQKYSSTPNTIHCEFCGFKTHATIQCKALDALVDRQERTAFKTNETPEG